jgi:gliding motility-associated-like protein
MIQFGSTYKRLMLVIILAMWAVASAMAQGGMVVSEGETRTYQVENHAGSSYFWIIYNEPTFTVTAPAAEAEFTAGNNSALVSVQWKKSGSYYITVFETDLKGCNNTKAVSITVQNNYFGVLFANTVSTACYLTNNDFTVPLQFKDVNGQPISEIHFPVVVSSQINGVSQPSQTVTFANSALAISGSSFTANPNSDTPVEITLTGVTDANLQPIQVVNISGLNKHTHTIFRSLTAPSVLSQTTNNGTPTISGTASVGINEKLSVSVNGFTYVKGDGNLALSGITWTLTIPAGRALPEGTYEITATVANVNCNLSDNTTNELIINTIKSPLARIQGSSHIVLGSCNVQGTILDGSKSIGDGLIFNWSPSVYLDNAFSSKPVFHPGKSTRYILTVTDSKGLKDTISVMISVSDAPKAITDKNVFVDTPKASILLNGTKSTGSGLTYLWLSKKGIILNGETKPSTMVTGLGVYSLNVTDSYGCTSSDTVNVRLYIQAITDTASTKINQNVLINVVKNDIPQGSVNPTNISVMTMPLHGTVSQAADSLILYMPEEYYVGQDEFVYTICDNFGNCNSAKVLVTIKDLPFFIPEAFSPNGDGINDKFQIKGLAKYKTIEIVIFNRWGNIVYQSKNYGDGIGKDGFWDGKATNGLRIGTGDVPSGTYYYILTLDRNEKISKSVYLDR